MARAAAAVAEADAQAAVPVAAAHDQRVAAARVGARQRDRAREQQVGRKGGEARALAGADGRARAGERLGASLDAVPMRAAAVRAELKRVRDRQVGLCSCVSSSLAVYRSTATKF